ncbi:50S ribosomal protein L6 [Candidatus Woesearchaeota archaeon]|nr:50S ribosomal protein L6 [Candidatus Woesearchaeota archaeon]
MKFENISETIPLPEGVTAQVNQGVLTIKGSKGEVKRNLIHPKVIVGVASEGVTFNVKLFTKAEKKVLNTFKAHVKNLICGVTKGHEYKLRVCSGHFPMNVSIKGPGMEVKNFIGEAVPRTLTFKDGVDVKLDGDMILVSGINKELVAQAAASIEKLTRRNGFDRRRFQDGIYIVEKDGKKL